MQRANTRPPLPVFVDQKVLVNRERISSSVVTLQISESLFSLKSVIAVVYNELQAARFSPLVRPLALVACDQCAAHHGLELVTLGTGTWTARDAYLRVLRFLYTGNYED